MCYLCFHPFHHHLVLLFLLLWPKVEWPARWSLSCEKILSHYTVCSQWMVSPSLPYPHCHVACLPLRTVFHPTCPPICSLTLKTPLTHCRGLTAYTSRHSIPTFISHLWQCLVSTTRRWRLEISLLQGWDPKVFLVSLQYFIDSIHFMRSTIWKWFSEHSAMLIVCMKCYSIYNSILYCIDLAYIKFVYAYTRVIQWVTRQIALT